MNRVGFSHEVFAELLFTADEVCNMMECSESHYDHLCQRVGQHGGFLYGLNNRFVGDLAEEDLAKGTQSPFKLSFREIDTLCKILEGPGADVELA